MFGKTYLIALFSFVALVYAAPTPQNFGLNTGSIDTSSLAKGTPLESLLGGGAPAPAPAAAANAAQVRRQVGGLLGPVTGALGPVTGALGPLAGPLGAPAPAAPAPAPAPAPDAGAAEPRELKGLGLWKRQDLGGILGTLPVGSLLGAPAPAAPAPEA